MSGVGKLLGAAMTGLDAIGAGPPLRRALRPLRPAWRAREADHRAGFEAFLGGADPARQHALDRYPRQGTVLVVGYEAPGMATFQTPFILAARLAGKRVRVLLPTARCAAAEFYRRIGACDILESERLIAAPPQRRAAALVAALRTPADLLAVEDGGIPCGKFAVSTLMRRRRAGSIDPTDPALRPAVIDALAASLQAAALARRVMATARPELVCFYDRGYTPDGELFEAALAAGAQASTLNAAHRSGAILTKRYRPANKDSHFGMPSEDSWRRLEAMPWTERHWQALRRELETCYASGLWYDEVGTQFDTRLLPRQELMASLGLDPAKKTAVIFPHLFWDATFFWGNDLFADYRDWFVEAVKAAAANPALNWIIKIHPANLVKNRRDNYQGECSEVLALREALGTVPDHIKIIPPDSPISTLSLFDIMDVCLTVRGTVGLEAALFGKSVLTAGTGRYDGFGFTIDSDSREAYLQRLSRLQEIGSPTPEQTERARRYGFGLFLLRPLKTTSMRFQYRHDAAASLETRLDLPAEGRLEDRRDLALLADWMAHPDRADLLGEDNAEAAIAAVLETSDPNDPVCLEARPMSPSPSPDASLSAAARDLLQEVLPAPLRWEDQALVLGDRIVPLRDGIPRFRDDSGYNQTFAMQWGRFRTNQFDDVNGTGLSRKRFAETGWDLDGLRGRKVLEAGCGAGRFTRLLAEAGARLVAFDYSAAVDVSRDNNGAFANVAFAQCDILDMPFRDGAFDDVFCHGVLQHTPDPEAAFHALARKVAPGGRISIDVYRKDGLVRPWKSKYLWRWKTSKMEPERLLRVLEWYIPKWLPIDTLIKRIPYLGTYLGAVIPCWNYWYTDLSPDQKVQWAIMDTFDALAPAYDLPATLDDVRRWFADAGLSDVDIHPGGNGVVGNGTKRA
jgi:SAM-dependent methyltransferase